MAEVKKKSSKKKKSNIGRPPKVTENVVQKLEAAFSMGCTDEEASFRAGIAKNTLYNYIEKNPDFLHRKEALKKDPAIRARQVILDALDDGDVQTARWLLDKTDGKAKESVELTGKGGGPLETKNTVTVYIPDNGRE